jgi:hypothetical protein
LASPAGLEQLGGQVVLLLANTCCLFLLILTFELVEFTGVRETPYFEGASGIEEELLEREIQMRNVKLVVQEVEPLAELKKYRSHVFLIR